MTDSTLKEQDDISKERLAAFMAFLPRQLCVRLRVTKDASNMDLCVVQLIYVSSTLSETVEVRDTLFSDSSGFLQSANYKAHYDRAEYRVFNALKAWNWGTAENNDRVNALWNQPKPFVGIWINGARADECEASDPRLMFFYGLMVGRVESTIEHLQSAGKVHQGVQRDLRALERLHHRLRAFVTQSYNELVVSTK